MCAVLLEADSKSLLRPPKRWADGWGRKQQFPLLKPARLGLRVNRLSS